MNSKDGRRRLKELHEAPRADLPADSFDRAIDETIRWHLMRHEPPARAYAKVLDAVRQPTGLSRDVGSFRSWTIGAASAVAAVLLLGIAFPGIGVTALQVTAEEQNRGHLFLVWLSSTPFATWINESETVFGYSGILFCHTFGLAIVVGTSMAVNLRLLGAAPRLDLAALRPLFRFMWVGFWVNALSGALLFAANAPGKAANPLFEIKLALVAAGVVVMALIERRLVQSDSDQRRGGLPPSLRVLAGVSLLVWIAAIAAGRLIAYSF